MATIEELEQRAANIEKAEAAAIGALAAGMRELAVQLPEGSRLALTLAVAARELDPWAATPEDAGEWGGRRISNTTLQTVEEQSERRGVERNH